MDQLWYKNAIFYELYIKGFQDSNGDGNGDIPGLTSRLDYLADLGIDCIWLLPMYPSPMKDSGYDITDYCNIASEYGTLKDFKNLIKQAHKKNIKIFADLVINHTSADHPWFKDAKKGKSSKYHDYYVWSTTPKKYKEARVIFKDTETSNWTWCSQCKKYYWHRFFSHQPDLNFDNPKVRQEMLKIISFWFELGLDGFRVDAVPYLFQREKTNCENLPETHEYIKSIRKFIDEKFPGKVLLAEANQWPEDLVAYFGNGDQFHMAFNFPLMPRLFMAIKQEHHGPIVDIIKRMPHIPDNCQWATFLRNHDELTLEMCTDEERDYMYKEYAKDKEMKLNIGIRRRLAPLLDNDRRKIELLNTILFTLPGAPVIYYGDEIGMGDNIYLGDREGVRTPMQWNDNRNAGFSTSNPSKLYTSVILDPEYNYNSVNVSSQKNSNHSLLKFIKKLIKIRKENNVLAEGKINFIYPENKKILVYIRELNNKNILCVFNIASSSQAVQLDLNSLNGYTPIEMMGGAYFPTIGELPYLLTVAPYGYYILSLEKNEEQQT